MPVALLDPVLRAGSAQLGWRGGGGQGVASSPLIAPGRDCSGSGHPRRRCTPASVCDINGRELCVCIRSGVTRKAALTFTSQRARTKQCVRPRRPRPQCALRSTRRLRMRWRHTCCIKCGWRVARNAESGVGDAGSLRGRMRSIAGEWCAEGGTGGVGQGWTRQELWEKESDVTRWYS